jgi:hypothetical protein
MRTVVIWLCLTVLYAAGLVIAGTLMPLDLRATANAPLASNAPWELPLYLAGTMPILALLVHRATRTGVTQLVALLVGVWGLQTGMTQVETAYFLDAFPQVTNREMVNLFTRTLLPLALVLPTAMAVTGKLAQRKAVDRGALGDPWPLLDWRLPVLGLAYVAIYFAFGYFVAWQFEPVRLFYTGSGTKLPVITHVVQTLTERPSLLPFQFLRGMLWTIFLLPVLQGLGRSRRESLLTAALLMGLLPTVQLVFTNPLIPAAVRGAHFLEVALSGALFGTLIAWSVPLTRFTTPDVTA